LAGRGGGGIDPRSGRRAVTCVSSEREINRNAGGDAKACGATNFLLLGRTRNGDFGLELREIVDLKSNLVHLLAFPFF